MSSLIVNLARKVSTTSVLSIVKCPVVGKKAIAKHALASGAVLNVFKFPVLTYPTMHTVQLTEGVHVAPTDGAECISHQCGPDTNSAVVVADDCQSAAFVATRDVAEGEEMTFNYNTTEWEMSSPFPCVCKACQAKSTSGAAAVSQVVRGFKYLTLKQRAEIAHMISPAVHDMAMDDAQRQLDVLKSNSPATFPADQSEAIKQPAVSV